jgi:putative phage-type endonuclease
MSERRGYLGGTDAAAVLGVHHSITPLELWLRKTGRKGESDDASPALQRIWKRGHILEPFIRDMAVEKLREQGHAVKVLATNQRYHLTPFIRAEIDFELELDGRLINADCKSVTSFRRDQWGEEGSDEVPLHYAAQFMHGLACTDRDTCLVAALLGLDDVALYWVHRDRETISAMIEREQDFWLNHVQADIPPDPVKFSDVRQMFPVDNGLTGEVGADVASQVDELRDLRRRVKQLKSRDEELSFALARMMGPYARITHKGAQLATWQSENRTEFDLQAFRAAHPGMAELFTTRGRARVFRLK